MIVFKRNTSPVVYAVWVLALIGVGLGIYFLLSGRDVAALASLAASVILWVYPVYGLTIMEDSIVVKRTVAFGFRSRSFTVAPDSGYRGELITNGYSPDGGEEVDSVLNFVYLLVPFLYRSRSLWIYDIQYNKLRMLVKLSYSEYDQILRLSRLDKALPLTGAIALWPLKRRFN
ncbi:hypothetical protein GCM10023184_00290 [Flaviaesturariibacter amylovorans]|uniref:PH domain-containing protein n=2 Tax=Flaviaesturariibacter amylovorans TaxID=1084520 RepID=A0ABP8G3R4_9BACT